MDWGKTNNRLLTEYVDLANYSVSQVWALNPDGTGLLPLTLPPAGAGGPSPLREHRYTRWRESTEDWLAVGCEMPQHYGLASATSVNPRGFYPGVYNGLFADLYVANTASGFRQWYNLTNLYTPLGLPGSKNPVWTPDGNTMYWNDCVNILSTPSFPLSNFRMAKASFTVNAGVPSLGTITYPATPGIQCQEVNDISPDGTKVLFNGYEYLDPFLSKNIFTLTIADGTITELTNDSGVWNEWCRYSQDGTKIVFTSSRAVATLVNGTNLALPAFEANLITELWTMNPDGTNKVQLTHFNTGGYPESQTRPTVTSQCCWSPDGTQILVKIFGSGASGYSWDQYFGIYTVATGAWRLLPNPYKPRFNPTTHRVASTARTAAAYRAGATNGTLAWSAP